MLPTHRPMLCSIDEMKLHEEEVVVSLIHHQVCNQYQCQHIKMRSEQAQIDSTTLNEGYSSNDEDTSTTNADDKAIQTSPYQILFVLQVRELLLMTAMEVIESGDVQAAAAYGDKS